MKSVNNYFLVLAVLVLALGVSICTVIDSQARQLQPGDVEISIDLLPALTEAQALSLAQLGIDTRGAGTRLFNLIIENRTSEQVGNLYLAASVHVSSVGKIVQLDQSSPFSLTPNQIVRANNNSLQTGLPGVPERVRMNGDLTPQGENFINNLEGSTRLPDLLYSVNLQIYSGGPRGQGVLISEASATVPIEGLSDDLDVFLIQPGDVIGTEAPSVVVPYPVFRWEGSPTRIYRIVVVQDVEGQTPESLIQSALSTNPVTTRNIPASATLPIAANGSLLEFEVADILTRGASLNYPTSGSVQALQMGQTYYWQILEVIRTPSGVEYQASEIYHFRLGLPDVAEEELRDNLMTLLEQLLEPAQYEALIQGGFNLDSINMNGITSTGPSMEIILEDILRQMQDGEIERID